MKLKRRELFRYFEEIFGNEYYIGFHGISDNPDIKNQYADMKKTEKAENILKEGLINERQISIKSTCKIFGRLSDAYEKDKSVIWSMNEFSCYRTAKQHVVIIVAVPVSFKHSDGRNIFGGWMNPNQGYSDDDSPFECVTDKLFKKRIPREMIFGYYYFDDNDKEAELVLNDEYYDKLSQEQKDRFIEEMFDKNNLDINLNKENFVEDIIKKCQNQSKTEYEYINGNIYVRHNHGEVKLRENMVEQANEFMEENEKPERITCVDGYTFEELENIPIEQIDIERVIPTYEMITSSKYQIKEILINKTFRNNMNIANEIGYYSANGIEENEHVNVTEFEEWVKKYRNPDELYEEQYQRYYKEIEEEFKKHIRELKGKRMQINDIDLNSKIREYMEIGNEIGLFENADLKEIFSKIKDVEIVEDNTLTGDAMAEIINGKNVIKINKKRCEGQGKHFLDEVIFHELTHFVNEIHLDLYGDRAHNIMAFKKKYSDFSKNNQLIKFPEWGAILLDEAISQKVAQAMCEKKYGKGIYQRKSVNSKLIDEKFILFSDFADYPEYERVANNFSKTIVGSEGLMGLAKLSMKKDAIDTIFSKYSRKKDGAKNLYEILGYMGNIAIADYASKGHFIVPNSEENRTKQNVLESMQKANWIIEDVIEQSGPSFDD